MNPTPEASPLPVRLVCRATRLWCAVSESTSSTHVAGCEACQRHFAGASALSSALRTEAGVTLSAIDPAASQRTWRAVRDAQAAQTIWADKPRDSGWRFHTLAGVAAVAALIVTAILIRPEQMPMTSPATARVTTTGSVPVSPEAVLLVEAMQSWSEQWSESVLPTAGQLAANNPLQVEMSSVYADARAALDFLALNFLPTRPPVAEPASQPKSTG